MPTVTFAVQRFDPTTDGAPWSRSYELEVRPMQTVLEALQGIRSTIDPSLAFRGSCRSGICGDCAVMINGVPRLACGTMVSEAVVDGRIEIAPLRHFPVLRDLVVDFDPFLEALRSIVPWVETKPDHAGLMSPETVLKVEATNGCILCGICEAQWEGHSTSSQVAGPMAMAKAYRLAFDSRDTHGEARLRLAVDLGLLGPETANELQRLCPKAVPFADEIFPALRAAAVPG